MSVRVSDACPTVTNAIAWRTQSRERLILLLRRPELFGDLALELIELAQLGLFAREDLGLDHAVDLVVGDEVFLRRRGRAGARGVFHRVEENLHPLFHRTRLRDRLLPLRLPLRQV